MATKKEAPSAKWRIYQFIPHFEKAGIHCTVLQWRSGMIARLAQAKQSANFDIVVLQKRLLTKIVLNRFRRFAKVLVFEFDDAGILKKGEDGYIRGAPARERRFRRMIRLVDAVTTTNKVLAEQARRETDHPERIHILPSVIDLSRWQPRPVEEGGDKVTIGWMGTPSNLPSVDVLKSPLVRLCRKYENLYFKLVCDEKLEMPGVRVDHIPYQATSEIDDARSFDIAVAPLIEDAWTRGKVSTKLLAYFAAALPVVASNVNANRLYIRDGENGYLVGTLGEWEDRLTRLVEDPTLRREMGQRAREVVEREYSIDTMVPRYVELFTKLAEQGKGN